MKSGIHVALLAAAVFFAPVMWSCDDSGTSQDTSDVNSGTNSGTNDGTNSGTDGTNVQAGVFYVQIPSSVAGDEGIAVRVEHPGTFGARYADGAPVFVEVQGGHESGRLDPADAPGSAPVQNGIIRIQFLMPGGRSGPFSSGGSYDYRGPKCRQALADVILYAAGVVADTQGLKIGDRLPFAMTSMVGVVGLSNGGNLMLKTLASHPEALEHVSWMVTWESPIGDQYVTVELGGGSAVNPYYNPGTCTLTSCPLPGMAEVLTFDASWSGVAEDPATGQPVSVTGRLCLDENSDGICQDREFVFSPLLGPSSSGTPLRYVSVELTEMMDAEKDRLFPAGWPDSMATVDQVRAYWQERDGSLVLESMPEAFAQVPWILIGTQRDHVQGAPDHPHVTVPYSFMASRTVSFVRLNPDSAYMAALSGLDAGSIPENDPMQPLDGSDMAAYMLPERIDSMAMDPFTTPAAVLELADRVHDGLLSGDLDAPLHGVISVIP